MSKQLCSGTDTSSSFSMWDVPLLFTAGANCSKGGVQLLGILSGGVPSGSSNPDPISDQKMSFSTPIFRPDLLNPYPFSDLAFRQKLSYRYLDQSANKKIPQIHFEFAYFSFSYSLGIETINTFIHSHSSLENHTRFQTKMSKVYTVFRPKWRKNPTRWSGPYLYSLYEGVTPWAISTRQNIIQYIVQLVFLIYTYPLKLSDE